MPGWMPMRRNRTPVDAVTGDVGFYRMPGTGFHLVTSFELAREVIRQPDLFASSEDGGSAAEQGTDAVPEATSEPRT